MNTYLKFSCIYCGQHMECSPCLSGRQILCPACLHRITIPTPRGGNPTNRALTTSHTWDSQVPFPQLEIPTRHRIAPERRSPTRLAGVGIQASLSHRNQVETGACSADKDGFTPALQRAGSESGAPPAIPQLAQAA